MAIFYQASTAEKTLPASFCSIQKLPQLFEETHAAIAAQTVVALKPKCKQRSCKSTHRRDQRTDGLLRHREHPLVPLESCSDTQGSAESSPRDRSNMRPSIEPCDESSLDFFAEHPQAYCGHRHALAHTITDANYTQKHHAEAESTPLTRRSEK